MNLMLTICYALGAVSLFSLKEKYLIYHSRLFFLPFPTFIIATDVGSPCQYDEGSPLVQTMGTYTYAIGIMSKNKGCGPGVPPTIYTRLTSYYSWFNKIGGLQPAP